MLQSGGLSTSMSSAASTSEHNESPFFVSLCDMDDTAVYNNTKTIKNAHLLLPIKLFLSKAPNQLLRILTNRNSVDEADNPNIYRMSQYLADLNSFGIELSQEDVIFAGNIEVSGKMTEDWHELNTALEIVQKHLQSLRLTETGQELSRLIPPAPRDPMADSVGPLAKLVAAKFHGKNYHINRFLVEHHKDSHYQFGKYHCSEDALTVIMVDDLDTIAETTKALGSKRFIGIKAPGGGKFPERVPDYYKVDYLLSWAQRIGLTHYAQSLIHSPQDHREDNRMLQLAGLLFAWQAFPEKMSQDHFFQLIKLCNQAELSQIANMLQYIKKHPNLHKDAHYKPIDELSELFQIAADEKFLDEYLTQLERVQSEKIRLSAAISSRPLSPLPEETPAIDKSAKRGGFGSFIKTLSSRSSSTLTRREPEIQSKEAGPLQAQLERLLIEERAFKDRLLGLTHSSSHTIATKARRVLAAAQPEEQAAGHRASSSTSSSSGAASRASSEEFLVADATLSPPPVTPLRSRSKEARPVFVTTIDYLGGPSDDSVIRRASSNSRSGKK